MTLNPRPTGRLAGCLFLLCAVLLPVSARSDELIPLVDLSGEPEGITTVPEGSHPLLRELFQSYTHVRAPNGRPIHLLAQSKVTRPQLVRAREVLRFYLTDVPGSRFGADKTSVANAMANRRATLVFFDTERASQRAFEGGLPELELFFQDLYATEAVVEGSEDYLSNGTRDATLEEVFHLVQGAGIQFALPEYQKILENAARQAARHEKWFTNPDWVFEGSSSFEYIISVIDVYYGLWAHDPDGNGESFGGEYRYATRAAIEKHDALGVEALRMFLPQRFSFDARIDAGFEGAFTLVHDSDRPYTLKSRWLSSVRLTGDKSSHIVGNDGDNVLRGNRGDNRLDGAGGHDVAVFTGIRKEYEVVRAGDETVVTDTVTDRDGRDTLVSIEEIRFSGEEPVKKVAKPAPLPREMELAPPFRRGPEAYARFLHEELTAIYDRDGNGRLGRKELSREFRRWHRGCDEDGNGSVTRAEILAFCKRRFEREGAIDEVELLLGLLDGNDDGSIARDEVPGAYWKDLREADRNGDQDLSRRELVEFAREFSAEEIYPEEETGVRFEVEGSRAIMNGVIDADTPDAVRELLADHPALETIVMVRVPGSEDDFANVEAALLVKARGLNTHVAPGGMIASGGVDFFLAGRKRTAGAGARFGVHSWGDEVLGMDFSGSAFPRDHDSHRLYLEYYRKIGVPEGFYWFTLEAAPVEGNHWVTAKELKKFGMLTED